MWLLLRHPVPLVILTIGEPSCLAHSIIVDPVIVDVGLIRKRWPGAEHEWILLHRHHGFGKINRHKPTRHQLVYFRFGIAHSPAEVAKIFQQQFSAANSATIIVQVVMDQIGVIGIDARVFVVLVFSPVPGVVLIKHIMVVDQRLGRPGKVIQQQLLHFWVKHALHFSMIVEVLTL